MVLGAKNFTKGPIFKQLIVLAMPIMATSFVQMVYAIVNMAWVGRLGSESVAAVGAVGILAWLSSSAGLLSKISAEVSIGQSLGVKKLRQALAYASHANTVALILGICVMCGLFFWAEPILSFFKLSKSISSHAQTYLRIISFGIPFFFLELAFTGIYNGIGRSYTPFYLSAIGLGCNMLLDPLLIYGLKPIPALGFEGFSGLGINGAAIATVFSQFLGFTLFIYKMRKTKSILNHFPLFVRLRKQFTLRIFHLGLPVAIMNFCFSFINMYIARIASIHGGHIGVTAQTTGGQIEGITWNSASGFSTALGTFVAQNYAAGKLIRARTAYRYTLVTMLSLGAVVSCSFIFFGENIFRLIVPEQLAAIAGGEYLFVLGFSQLFMMLEMTTQGMFNGMGYTIPPAIVSILFNLARIPLALLLAPQMGLTGVWIAITISSILKGTVLPLWLTFLRKQRNKLKTLKNI